MRKEEEIYHFRSFLNEKTGTALIEMSAIKWPATTSHTSTFEGNITLKDCSRQIDLDFYFNDEEGRKARLYKIEMLEEQIRTMRAMIETFVFDPKLEEKEVKKKVKKGKKSDKT